MWVRRLWLGAFLVMSVLCSMVQAQEAEPDMMPLVVVDTEKLFSETRLGKRIREELLERRDELRAENARITADLTEEEQALTALRADMDPEAFREIAEEFDNRVQSIRRARDAADAAFNEANRAAPFRFVEQILPVLKEMMAERGAVALLNRQVVLLSLNSIDITDEAVTRIDAVFGDGTPETESADQ